MDKGEYWVEQIDGGLRFKGFSGIRKGGWMSATTQPNPGELPYHAWRGEVRRDEKGVPTSIHYVRDWWLWQLAEPFPYYPDYRTTKFLSRNEVSAERKGGEVRFARTQFIPVQTGQGRFEFRTPDWVPAGYPREVRTGSFPIMAVGIRRETQTAKLPGAERIYASEFEPFLLEPEFPKRLLKAIEEDKTLEYWVVGRTMQFFRVRAYYLGRQRLVFREIDQTALRFDLASFRKDEKGRWDPLAGVWLDPETGKLILADDSYGLTRGFISPTCFFRPEPERTSDFDFVYPKFVAPTRYLQ